MTTAAEEIAITAGQDPTNTHDALTWNERLEITRSTMKDVIIPFLKTQTMFTVSFPGIPFIRRRVSWAWITKPLEMIFNRALKDMAPVDVTAEDPS